MLQGLFYITLLAAGQIQAKKISGLNDSICNELAAIFFALYACLSQEYVSVIIFALPVIYLFRSTAALAVYFAGLFFARLEIIWYILLLSLSAPYVLHTIKHFKYQWQGQLTAWLVGIYLTCALFSLLEILTKSPLASVIFSCYFSSLYIFDKFFYKKTTSIFFKPFALIRIIGTTVLSQIFTFDLWSTHPLLTWQLLNEYIITLMLIGIAVYMLIYSTRDFSMMVFGGYFILNIFCYGLTYINNSYIPIIILTLQRLYTYASGIALLTEAYKTHNLWLHIIGSGIIAMQLMLRLPIYNAIWIVPAYILLNRVSLKSI